MNPSTSITLCALCLSMPLSRKHFLYVIHEVAEIVRVELVETPSAHILVCSSPTVVQKIMVCFGKFCNAHQHGRHDCIICYCHINTLIWILIQLQQSHIDPINNNISGNSKWVFMRVIALKRPSIIHCNFNNALPCATQCGSLPIHLWRAAPQRGSLPMHMTPKTISCSQSRTICLITHVMLENFSPIASALLRTEHDGDLPLRQCLALEHTI